MALRIEDLETRGATVVAFPTGRVRSRVRYERMIARRRRAGAVSLALAVGLAAFLTGGTSVASREGAPKAIVLQPGDTVWGVAERYAPPGMDPRAYVDRVLELNGLEAPPAAGLRLRLP
ncbi:MAG TPA: hypothetical protein VM573_03830 [Actinomycetota bacterium]|nr:hypothetical protein [Actinomycetota bacterium]